MRSSSSIARRTIAFLVATLAMIGMAASPARASADHQVDIRGTAVCDAAANEWQVTWAVTNRSDVAGTIGNVRPDPADRPVTGLWGRRVQPGETVTGEQRLLWWQYTGHLTLDVNWDDGVVTYDHSWPIYIRIYCGPRDGV